MNELNVSKARSELNRTGFFGNKRNVIVAITVLVLTLGLSFLGVYLYFSEPFKDAPTVEVKALNNFDKTIHVVTDMDYAPYSYIDDEGEYLGMDVEMMNEIANRLQMNLDLKLMAWPEANRRFLDGKADVIMNMESDMIINNPNIIATLPTTEKQYVVYGEHSISSVAELYGRRVASLHRMPGLGLDDEVSYVNSYDKIFHGLKTGEYEFAICPIQVGNAFLEKFDLNNFQPSYAVTHVYVTLAMHPEDTMLRVRINAVLIQMQQEGRLAALDRKWIVSHYENMTITEMIKSRPWLAASILVSFFIVLILVLSIIFQHRQAIEREAAQQELAENFITITEQSEQLKHQQVDLIAAIDRAEQSSKAKTTFLFNMSHDIRTPMNAIIGYVELANKLTDTCKTCTRPRCPDEIPTKLRDFLQKIGASSQHLLALINDVLEMSRIESGKMELEPVDTDLVRMLNEVKDMFSSQMTTKHIEFIIDTSKIQDRMAICDNHRFNRVLLNLLSNAYKFTPEGGQIKVTMIQLGDSWEFADSRFANYELRVKDNGIGMTPEFAAKVF